MGTLCLLRHATAENASDDAARVLTVAGRAEARAVGAALAAGGWAPGRILCSTAVRARQTVECAVLGGKGDLDEAPVVHDERLYLASPERLLGCLAEVDDGCKTVLMVAHNPGLGELVVRLSARDKEAAGRFSGGFPPATLAVLAADTPWARFGLDPCRLVALRRPGQG